MPTAAEPWTTRRLLSWMNEAFGGKGLDSPRLSAEILLAHVLKTERLKLYMDPDRPASADELATLRGLAGRALKHEPVQYLTGEAWFFGMPFHVDRRVLVPRPETEGVVERVVQAERRRLREAVGGEGADEPALVVDVCTGSGCIAAALAKGMPTARVIATDVSAEALEVAARNLQRHGLGERVELRQGDLAAPLGDVAGQVDYLVSNPPYIPDAEWADVPANVKQYEPELALRGGADGLTYVRRLIEAAPGLLSDRGWMMVEIAASTGEAALEIARRTPGLERAALVKDLAGLDRFVVAERGA